MRRGLGVVARTAAASRWAAAVLESGEPAGGVPGGGAGPQLSRPSAVWIGIRGPAIAGVSTVVSQIALTREKTSRISLRLPW